MSTTKESLFTEFLKDKALQPQPEVKVSLEIVKKETVSYKFPAPDVISEEEIKIQWRSIRNFFRTGKHSGEDKHAMFMPVLLAPYLANEELITDYPMFLSERTVGKDGETEMEHCSFYDLLNRTFNKTFKEGEAKILLKNLPRIESFVRKFIAKSDNFCTLNSAINQAITNLSKLKVSGEDGINFLKDVEIFKNNLPKTGKLLGFSRQTPIHLLVHLLKYQSLHKRKTFITEINRLKSGLKDLLAVEKNNKSNDQNFDFANSLIEFKKLNDFMPDSSSELMQGKRAERINQCIKVMESAEKLLLKHGARIYVGSTLAENNTFKWDELLTEIDVHIAPPNESCSSTSNGFNAHITSLAKLMASVRIAELELKNKYDEEIHGDYFSRFNWNYFTEEETALCPPVVLLEETQNLLGKELHHFSALIASSKAVKVLAINKSFPFKINKNGREEDEWFTYQQELSALAISHRSAFTHQSATHNPVHLLKGFELGLACSTPALFHVLISSELNSSSQNFLEISSAVEGRQFPLFIYNAKGKKWGSRFDISANPQADRDWPKYSFEINTDSGTNVSEKLELAFTFADFYAVNNTNNKNLLIAPPSCWTDDLISMSEFLELSSEELYAKVPYIWLADNENTLHRAAVPFSLVIAAKERLDFWNFIQELGGVNSYHVEQAINRTRDEMQEQKEKDIRDLEISYKKQIEEVRNSAAGEAMNNLAGILLDLESITSIPSVSKVDNKSVAPKSIDDQIVEITTEQVNTGVEVVEKEASVSNEPWVETFRCTSCNDCTDKYPRAFKYDSEKQAYIDDATTITYAQLVKSAEACPAKCIHPGMPLNPNEPGLEDLIRRANLIN